MTLPKKPLSRTEQYLNKLATGTGELPSQPLSRSEQYLAYICENGGVGGGGGDNSEIENSINEVKTAIEGLATKDELTKNTNIKVLSSEGSGEYSTNANFYQSLEYSYGIGAEELLGRKITQIKVLAPGGCRVSIGKWKEVFINESSVEYEYTITKIVNGSVSGDYWYSNLGGEEVRLAKDEMLFISNTSSFLASDNLEGIETDVYIPKIKLTEIGQTYTYAKNKGISCPRPVVYVNYDPEAIELYKPLTLFVEQLINSTKLMEERIIKLENAINITGI